MSQKPYLYQTTVQGNVDLKMDSTKENIERVCRQSGASEFIKNLKLGYPEQIGQNGAKLSGGERQKIAVARMLIKGNNIILLDEASSGYDTETNEKLHDLIITEFKDRTVIMVTHRMEELKGFDYVYELKDGEISNYNM